MQCDKEFSGITTFDNACKNFSARCCVCGKEESRKKQWFRSRDKTLNLLQMEFNLCPYCNRWVCEDCFLVSDGSSLIGICTECAVKQKITGYTIMQSMNGKNKNFKEKPPRRWRVVRLISSLTRRK